MMPPKEPYYSPAPSRKWVLTFCSLLLLGSGALAQDLGAVANNLRNIQDQSLSITGGITLTNQSYWASGIDPRRDALQWGVRANLSLNYLGFSAPFSLAFSDANTNFNLPSYTFAGISPRYKWITLHAGDRSLNFSKYTMNGISFRGAGITLEPGRWHFSSFYGRLNRALASDLDAAGNLNGYYDRTGYGFRFGYGGTKGSYHLNYFAADDNEGSFPTTELGNALRPTSNRVVSLQARQQLGSRLSLAGELGHSAYNRNQEAVVLPAAEFNLGNRFLGLFQPNESTVTGQAYNLGLFYDLNRLGLRASYERINRGFRTLGALFFNNDTENITLGGNYSFFENKLNVFLNGGLERTNLDAEEEETTDRIIASANINYRPDEQWFFSGGYSNFRNDTKLRGRTDLLTPVDSIFLAQVNQSINAMALRRLGTEQNPASLQLVINHQRANSIVNDEVMDDNNSRFTTAALSYSAGSPDAGWQWNAGLSFNFSQLGGFDNRAIAPTLGLNRNFFGNALATYLRSAFSFYQQGDDANNVFNLTFGGTYRLRNAHRLSLRATHINRFGSEVDVRNFHEWYGFISYGYRFGGSIGGNRNAANDQN
jgi:hypothetical protein